MGFFDFFGKKDGSNQPSETKTLPWTVLQTMDQLEAITEASKEKPVVIFKHSTTCGISRMVLRNFENSYEIPEGKINLYYLDLLAHRDISNEIAIRFQVIHQSPQILIIKNGSAVHHASHYNAQASDILQFVN